MKRLLPPSIDAIEVYSSCIAGLQSETLCKRLTTATPQVKTAADLYAVRAVLHELHLFQPSSWGNESQLVTADTTKAELTTLYTDQLASRKQRARDYYDHILLLAPLRICPYCGFGHASTLDHYLPKAYYPLFSVLPINLVPACKDCNSYKGTQPLDGTNDVSHPYFEDPRIESDTWLQATVNETTPPTASFSLVTPASWPNNLARRVENYFRDLKLASRFAVEASSELASLSDYLREISSSKQVSEHLELVAKSERKLRRNSWKAALYEALSVSAWYQDVGYRRVP
jgi:5-methylcytosine-specific restriction endonuclease McrA